MPSPSSHSNCTMKSLLMAAIKERRLIHVFYEDEIRTVEPHGLGKEGAEEDVVYCTQILPRIAGRNTRQAFRIDKLFVRYP